MTYRQRKARQKRNQKIRKAVVSAFAYLSVAALIPLGAAIGYFIGTSLAMGM